MNKLCKKSILFNSCVGGTCKLITKSWGVKRKINFNVYNKKIMLSKRNLLDNLSSLFFSCLNHCLVCKCLIHVKCAKRQKSKPSLPMQALAYYQLHINAHFNLKQRNSCQQIVTKSHHNEPAQLQIEHKEYERTWQIWGIWLLWSA